MSQNYLAFNMLYIISNTSDYKFQTCYFFLSLPSMIFNFTTHLKSVICLTEFYAAVGPSIVIGKLST